MSDIVERAYKAAGRVTLSRQDADALLLECAAEIESLRNATIGYAKLFGQRLLELESQLAARDAEITKLKEADRG